MLDIGPRLHHRPQEPLRSVASLLLRVPFDRLDELLCRFASATTKNPTPTRHNKQTRCKTKIRNNERCTLKSQTAGGCVVNKPHEIKEGTGRGRRRPPWPFWLKVAPRPPPFFCARTAVYAAVELHEALAFVGLGTVVLGACCFILSELRLAGLSAAEASSTPTPTQPKEAGAARVLIRPSSTQPRASVSRCRWWTST